jgi:CBS domain-containing protein
MRPTIPGRAHAMEAPAMPVFRTAGDLCTREVVTVSRATALNEAARLLRNHHVGCLVVIDETTEGRIPVGMLTDRDIVTAVVAKEVSPMMLRVADVMSEDVATVNESASLQDALALMRHRRVRRMPVVEAGGMLVGLLSTDDLTRLLSSELQSLAEVLGGQRQLEQMKRP